MASSMTPLRAQFFADHGERLLKQTTIKGPFRRLRALALLHRQAIRLADRHGSAVLVATHSGDSWLVRPLP
jgi:hypothetical protein